MDVHPVVERMPVAVGGVTLVIGAALAAAPGLAAGPLGLDDGQRPAVRLIGLSDLVLVPGLVAGRRRWPWMVARAALNLVDAAYLLGVAPRAARPAVARAGASALVGLAVVDGATGLALRRGEAR